MNWRISLLFVATLSMTGLAAAQEPLELQVKYGRMHMSYVVNDDGTSKETHEWSMTLLKDTAIEWAKRSSVSYSTSAQQAEVVSAYTLKADGRRIDVPKDNYQVEINRGKGKDSPVYSDISTLTVLFPEVMVGDTVVFSYRLVQTDPLFPKHFSVAQGLPAQMAVDDYRVRFDYPASLWVQYAARGMKQSESSEKGGRNIIEWSYTNPQPVKSERKNYSVYDPDKENGFAFSTFRDYSEISAAYGVRALPKAAITERIKSLAAEIVQGKTEPREQARALYEWVARNITYGGNCIGVGAVVPRDIPFILDNRMGDCKDHATLLQALLSARGIRSTQALINAGSVYRLPKIPVVSTVNHVINYLPDFDLFVDSTSNSTPFGLLPFQDEDKPVLLVEGFKSTSRTPAQVVGSNRETIKSAVVIAPNGSVSGSIEVFQRGISAVQWREWARTLTREWETDLVKNMFLQQGMVGSGKLTKDDPSSLTDEYHFKVDLNMEKFTRFPGSGAFYIYPVFGASGSIQGAISGSLEPEMNFDVACGSTQMTEEYRIELPANMKVLSIPEDLTVSNDLITYTSTYKLAGNVLNVKREMDDRTQGNICTPQVTAQFQDIGNKIMDDLKSQVLYK
jgi:transglutaminase-like putative cysteine protease